MMAKIIFGLLALLSISAFAQKIPSVTLVYGEVGYAYTLNGKMHFSCGPNPNPQTYYYNVYEMKGGEEYKTYVGHNSQLVGPTGALVNLSRGDAVIFKCSRKK